ncbi:two-component system response regulator [Desulfopila sp. IMCC35008]|uniref:response regulator n=1 Tax=Desulfopila sp. IMCC35008 TaxID=2653858 RepID=UPI0013D222B4|nr:HD domain-containing phosphohydrolase [Desulfopila sp. IMCC35008]
MSKKRILVVDDAPANLRLLSEILKKEYSVSVANSGEEALKIAALDEKPSLILLDVMMPEMDGYEVCLRLKARDSTKNIPVLFVTSMGEAQNEARGLRLGAVDYITKPINPSILLARVHTHMDLHAHREQLEELVNQRTAQLRDGYIDTVYRLTLISEFKDEDTGTHIRRISYYTKELARQLGMDDEFCEAIFYASPMHDIGKVALPDAILIKSGPLTDAEWRNMQTHTTVGAKILEGAKSPYLRMAIDIARHHHERWNGGGYPDGLSGEAIPLTARIMNITDQYDALRSKRPYKPAIDHANTVKIITQGDGRTMPEHFDPDILSAFNRVADTFNDIFLMHKDEE